MRTIAMITVVMLSVFPSYLRAEEGETSPTKNAEEGGKGLPEGNDKSVEGAPDSPPVAAEAEAEPVPPTPTEKTAPEPSPTPPPPPVVGAGVSADKTAGQPDKSVKKVKDEDKKAEDNGVEDTKEKKKKEKESFRVEARIHTRWEMIHHEQDIYDTDGNITDRNEVLYNQFKIQRTRIKLIFEPKDWVLGLIQLGGFQDVADEAASLLMDAYLHLSPSRYLEVRMGQFKKPFSRLALTGLGGLRVANRGIGNSLIVSDYEDANTGARATEDHLQYGDRDAGLQLSGRLVRSVKLDYEVGVFNGSGPVITRESDSKDLVGRLTIDPIKWLSIGANGSLKFFDKSEATGIDGNQNRVTILKSRGWAAGLDTLFKMKGVRLHLEGIMALDYRVPEEETPLILNLIAMVSYRHKFDVSWKLAVEPVFKLELLDPSSVYTDDKVMLYSPGLNIYLGDYVRLMIHGEIQRVSPYTYVSLSSNRNLRDSEELILQFCFDI